jgi:pyruvate dehydrogenase E2 component (dihydrolipoamide acetyltransferase)
MAKVVEARVPDIGGHSDVPVIELLVAEGDRVSKDQGLVTLESDKATMEVPSEVAGVVKSLKLKVGDAVSEGSVVALIEIEDADESKPEAKSESGSESKDEGKAAAAKASAPSKESESKAESKSESKADRQAESKTDSKSEAKPSRSDEAPRSPPVAFNATTVMPEKVPHASPAVRLHARELGVDLSRVSGSGRKGRITREDVNEFVKQALARPTAGGPAGGGGAGLNLLPWPKVDFAKFGEVEAKPLSRIKKISGANLARNWAMIPHVTQFEQADITEMEAFRKHMGEENPNQKITPLVFLIKAAVAALKAFPSFNASLDDSGENMVFKKYFHIGIAVDTPDGLVVPVIRDADKKGLLQLAAELGEISKKARDKKLGPADMSGGCFSISSLGGIGGTSFTPIINAPEVAILGVSKSEIRPLWNGKEFAPRLMLPLSLSYDHRVIDGAEAARFASFFAKQLGDIRRLLL